MAVESGSGLGKAAEAYTSLPATEVADILERAADLYQSEQVDWCANDWITQSRFTHKVSVCAGGALALASGVDKQRFLNSYYIGNNGDVIADPNYDKFREVLFIVSDILGEPVPSWNDNRLNPKSKEDVIELFRTLAKDFRNQIEKESSL